MATLSSSTQNLIVEAARAARVPPSLALAQARRESAFNPRAVSRRGAVGLFQLMPFNAKGIDPYNPRQNALRAMFIMRRHKDRFGTWRRALAAYVWGPAYVAARKPYPVPVKRYISDILRYQRSYNGGSSWGLPLAIAGIGAMAWFAKKGRK